MTANNFTRYSKRIHWHQDLLKILCIRSRSTGEGAAAATPIAKLNKSNCFEQEWENARPYDDIPSAKFSDILCFLPGGKYYNLSLTDLLMAFKRDFGNITKFKGSFGRKNAVITHNVEDFATVFRNEGIWPERPSLPTQEYYRSVHRSDFFKGTEGIVTTQGEKWANFRTVVNPVLMQPKSLHLYMDKMSQVNREFVERIRQIRDPNSLEVPRSFADELNRWTLESVSVVALDKQLGLISRSREDDLAKELFEAMSGFFKYILKVEFGPPIWKIYKTESFKNLMKCLDTITFTTSAYTNEAMQRLAQEQAKSLAEKPLYKKSVLERLIKIDKKIATVMVMDMLMAGVDTTSSAFTGLLLCLAKNPDKQAKLRDEIIRILPHKDAEFTQDTIRSIPYTRACIKEAMRIYPIVIGHTRVPVNDIVLSGYRVPKGTQVTMAFPALLDDNAYFPRPKEYLPERWLRAEKNTRNSTECLHDLKVSSPFVFLPFGFGPRSCVGRRIVEMELELGIARIIRNFQVEYNYPTENAFTNMLINRPQIPLTFKFIDIEH